MEVGVGGFCFSPQNGGVRGSQGGQGVGPVPGSAPQNCPPLGDPRKREGPPLPPNNGVGGGQPEVPHGVSAAGGKGSAYPPGWALATESCKEKMGGGVWNRVGNPQKPKPGGRGGQGRLGGVGLWCSPTWCWGSGGARGVQLMPNHIDPVAVTAPPRSNRQLL